MSRRWRVERLVPPNRLRGANGIAFGPDGRLYVAQYLSGQISAVDITSGDVEVVVAQGGLVRSPDDLAFAADGTMYIADLDPGLVWRRTQDGDLGVVSDVVQAPNGITCVGNRLFVNEMVMNGRLFEVFPDGAEPRVLTDGLGRGNAMQAGPDGYLYYPHMVTGQVWRISPDGGMPELVAADLDAPVAVRFDRAGVMMVLSCGPEGLITRIDLGTGHRSMITTGVVGLDNAAFDSDNRMFVSSFAGGGITEICADDRIRSVVPQGLTGPFGITADNHGTVYAADHFSLAAITGDGRTDVVDVVTGSLPVFVRGVAADGDVLQIATTQGEVHAYDPVSKTTGVRASGLSGLSGIVTGPEGRTVVAESDVGRIVAIDKSGTVTVLAEGLDHPVGVAIEDNGTCYVSEDRLGQVVRLADGKPVIVTDGLGAPQGLAIRGDDLFTIDVAHRRLLRISLTTGQADVDAENLPVAQFADITAAVDGSLLVSAHGEGTVLRLVQNSALPQENQ